MSRVLSNVELQVMDGFYGPMLKSGVRPIQLAPGEKRVLVGTDWEQNVLHDVYEVRQALESGRNVGLLLQGKGGIHPNPPGLMIVDQDSDRAFEHCDFDPFSFKVSRGVPDRAHFYALVLNPASPRRSRHVQGSHDVKLTGIVVGPLSRHKDGSIYQAYHRAGSIEPWHLWKGPGLDVNSLPRLDPLDYMALGRHPILKSSASLAVLPPAFRTAIGASDGWTGAPFVTCSRPLKERKFRAFGYLRNRIEAGDVSRSGMGGRATLLFIAVHLVVYLNLPKEFCLAALNRPINRGRSWNDSCVDAATGRPYPWSEAELNLSLDIAETLIPNFGVLEWERMQRRKNGDRCFEDFLQRINWNALGIGFHEDVAQEALHGAFLTVYDLPEEALRFVPFTRKMAEAIRTGRVKLKRVKSVETNRMVYRGLRVNKLIQLITSGLLRFFHSMGLSMRA